MRTRIAKLRVTYLSWRLNYNKYSIGTVQTRCCLNSCLDIIMWLELLISHVAVAVHGSYMGNCRKQTNTLFETKTKIFPWYFHNKKNKILLHLWYCRVPRCTWWKRELLSAEQLFSRKSERLGGVLLQILMLSQFIGGKIET